MKNPEEKTDPFTEAANRILGEVLNVIDILSPAPNINMISTASLGSKTPREAAVEIIKNSIARNFSELKSKVK